MHAARGHHQQQKPPSERGRDATHPVTGEVYKKQSITTDQISEFFRASAPSEPPVIREVVFDCFDVEKTSSVQLNETMYSNRVEEKNPNKDWAD